MAGRDQLDGVDLKILAELQEDGRVRNNELALRVGVSAPNCLRRLKSLFSRGVIRAVRAVATVPVIASGGAGTLAHFAPAVDAGADAVLAASVFHFGTLRIGQVKTALRGAGHAVR